MDTSYNKPDNINDDNRQWKKEEEINSDEQNLEKNGPDKSKDFKILHKDGSLGDLPDQQVPGGGALDGTVGLGT